MSSNSKRRRRAAAAAVSSEGTVVKATCPGPGPGPPELAPACALSLPVEERIALRAREIWETKGRPDGQDLDIWLAAEEEVLALPM